MINWHKDLKPVILPINKLMKNQFVLCLSSCKGFSACKMAMNLDNDIPFGALVGPLNDIEWVESAIAFIVFYNRLKGGNAFDAIDAMNSASGGENFGTTTGEKAKILFKLRFDEYRIEEIRDRLKT